MKLLMNQVYLKSESLHNKNRIIVLKKLRSKCHYECVKSLNEDNKAFEMNEDLQKSTFTQKLLFCKGVLR